MGEGEVDGERIHCWLNKDVGENAVRQVLGYG